VLINHNPPAVTNPCASMKINWNITAIVAPIVIAVIAWGVRLEVRIDRASNNNDRLTNIEELMRPLLVEHEVQKRLSEISPAHVEHIPEPEPVASQVREDVINDVDESIEQYRPTMKN